MDNCIFCKIISGKIPSHKVYEDDKILAFLDVSPVNPGHTLVITKEHHKDLLSLPTDLTSELILTVKKIAPAVVSGSGATGFNLHLNNGPVSGQVIDHVHFHIIPRYGDDGYHLWSGGLYQDGQAEDILTKIKKNI
jgi:histidine triad (HIT) family protein